MSTDTSHHYIPPTYLHYLGISTYFNVLKRLIVQIMAFRDSDDEKHAAKKICMK